MPQRSLSQFALVSDMLIRIIVRLVCAPKARFEFALVANRLSWFNPASPLAFWICTSHCNADTSYSVINVHRHSVNENYNVIVHAIVALPQTIKMRKKSIYAQKNALDYGNRLAAAHRAIRLMLLGSPPDMVHSALLHRVCPHNRKHLYIVLPNIRQFIFILYYTFPKKSRGF